MPKVEQAQRDLQDRKSEAAEATERAAKLREQITAGEDVSGADLDEAESTARIAELRVEGAQTRLEEARAEAERERQRTLIDDAREALQDDGADIADKARDAKAALDAFVGAVVERNATVQELKGRKNRLPEDLRGPLGRDFRDLSIDDEAVYELDPDKALAVVAWHSLNDHDAAGGSVAGALYSAAALNQTYETGVLRPFLEEDEL